MYPKMQIKYTVGGFVLLLFFVMCRAIGYVPISKTKVHILALVPLSGQEHRRGQAQLAGIQLALQEDLHGINSLDNTLVTFTYNDTKCESEKESKLISEVILHSSTPVLILGGGCSCRNLSTEDTARLSFGYMSNIIPRVSFEVDAISAATPSQLSVKESLFSVHPTIISYIISHQWRQVSIIYGETLMLQSGAMLLAEQLSSHALESSLLLKESTFNLPEVILGSDSRIVVAYVEDTKAADLICSTPQKYDTRYMWLLMTSNKDKLLQLISTECSALLRFGSPNMIVFEFTYSPLKTGEFQIFKHLVTTDDIFRNNEDLRRDAAYSYEATKLVLENLLLLLTSGAAQDWEDRAVFTRRLVRSTINSRRDGVMGTVQFNQDGQRKVEVKITEAEEVSTMETDTITHITELAGIPLSLFIIVCALSLLGIVYSVAILVFNVVKQKDKIIKMTSPNINVIVLLGAVFGYASLVVMGLDSSKVSLEIMAKLLQGGIFVLVLSITFIYGATFTKSWRVYMIFKNVNANGKMTRDEHLLLGLIALILLDLAVLLPWTLVDPIKCTQIALSNHYQASTKSDVTTLVDECSSSHLGVWVGVIYAYKALILGLGVFFTWQTRHVTLPALQDSKEVYLCIYTLVSMSLVCLPILLTSSIGMTVRYATGAAAVWLTITTTVTLLFIPKIRLYRKAVKDGQRDMKFQFKESMEKTREAVGKCLLCICCGEKEEDKYAEDVLHNEIETLKRTIKEKESTIRELTDRLYIGTEKFQEYLVSPKRNSTLEAMRRKHERRSKSAYVSSSSRQRYKPEKPRGVPRHLSLEGDGGYRGPMPAGADPDTGTFPLKDARDIETNSWRGDSYRSRGPGISVINVEQGLERGGYAGHGLSAGVTTLPSPLYHSHTSPSPNHDSAIDNNSPSSDTGSSERGEYGFDTDGRDSFKRRVDAYAAPIDLEAMESDATGPSWQEPNINIHSQSEVRTVTRPRAERCIELQPYRTAMINGVSVSQI